MSEQIDFNPKYNAPKFNWTKGLDTLEGYTSPITTYIEQIASEITERHENELVSTISERMGVSIDKKELERALNYDRAQYSEGFQAGYMRALLDYRLQIGQALGILTDIYNQATGGKEELDATN